MIPSHLLGMATERVPTWVDSMLKVALCYVEEDRDYVVRKLDGFARVMPVDFDKTGCIEPQKQWGGGLHQFLQLKHGLKMSPDSMVTTFISSLGYIKRYTRSLTSLFFHVGWQISNKKNRRNIK
jgi:preprotein translocase subunit SecA